MKSHIPRFSLVKRSFLTLVRPLVACLLLTVAETHASPVDDFYIQQAIDRYFSLPSDGQSLGMAGVTKALCSGPQCIYFNPAGLAQLKSVSMAGSMALDERKGEEFLEGDQIRQEQYEGFIAANIPLGSTESQAANYGVLSLGYSRYQGETDDSVNTTPDGHRRSVGYGLEISDGLALGYTFHFYDDQLRTDLADLHSHARFLHTWGAQYKLSERTTLAGVIQYGLGQSDTEDFKLQSNGLSRPRQITLSVAGKRQLGPVALYLGQEFSRLTSDGNLTEISSPAVVIGSDESGYTLVSRFGLEAHDLGRFALRAGLRHQWAEYTFDRTDLQSLTGRYSGLGISGGFGYSIAGEPGSGNDVRVDYGMDYARIGHGRWAHVVSMNIPFSL